MSRNQKTMPKEMAGKTNDSIIARHNRHNQKLHMVAFAFNLDGAFIGQFPPKLAFGGAVMSIWLALRNIL